MKSNSNDKNKLKDTLHKAQTLYMYNDISYKELPKYENIDGILCGSRQPGYYVKKDTKEPKMAIEINNKQNQNDLIILEELRKYSDLARNDLKEIIDEDILDEKLIHDLDLLYNKNVKKIYSLVNKSHSIRNPALIKYIWEKCYSGEYILDIQGVSIAIEDFQAPTQEQLKIITKDIINTMKKGKKVLIHCEYGQGRTGTILAAVHIILTQEKNHEKAIKYIRDNYMARAIESIVQIEALRNFCEINI